MTRTELGCCIALASIAALSTSAAAQAKKPKKHGGTPAASASASAPAASASASVAAPPPPAPSAESTSTSDDESAAAPAPSAEDKKIAVGADLLFVLPVGTMSNLTGPMIGPVLRGGYRIIPPLELTARLGYLFAFGKSQGAGVSTSVTDVPLWLGARYFVQDWPAGPYAAAEIGMNFLTAHTPGPSYGDTRAGFNLGVGYVVSKDLPIDLRLQFSYLNLIGAGSNEGTLLGIGLSAGYSLFF